MKDGDLWQSTGKNGTSPVRAAEGNLLNKKPRKTRSSKSVYRRARGGRVADTSPIGAPLTLESARRTSRKSKILRPQLERAPAPADQSAPLSFKLEVSEGPAPESGGLLNGLRNLLNGRTSESPNSASPNESPNQQESPMTNQSAADSSTHLEISEPAPAAALSPEVESKLAAVPDVIGAEEPAAAPISADGEVVDGGDEDALTADDIREMLDDVVIEDDDVRDLLEEGFAALAEYFGSEHWRLTPRQARLLGKPVAKLLNALWARLCQWLPEYIARWCEELPGLAGLIVASGLVVSPKVVKQWRITQSKRRGVALKPAEESAVRVPEVARRAPAAVVAPAVSKEVVAPVGA